ncbi:hypothetical protein [Vibrio neptunius]|uniref:Uncharacterized protein n=1 Tax=Vibrio neptunius TaxID=170651 RepID=A0ABS3A7T5_9VIBR|nr:hypothetical protein [Vibrio neptunius]MBN3495732.1 hypothetical protein [Vibrio neptunius]MBN3518156.1 hypothetical protein [Vibrio neptunius]MBN3552501.1 hypothetical protein [Vibrio neptunius]MBN3580541.1 hypothetical protein [Vibrio neptunius]MCH9874208.1 hypothetical protein [Vibrio neptunius]
MDNLQQQTLSSSFDQILNRCMASSEAQQLDIMVQLDAIAKKLPPIEVYRSTGEVLADIKRAMQGDRARVFFSHSFVSWYRSSPNKRAKPQLHHWSQLDMSNRRLYLEMLGLRDLGRWDDEALHQFEQYCLAVIGGKA